MCGEVDCEPGSIELSHADSVKECDCPESIDGFQLREFLVGEINLSIKWVQWIGKRIEKWQPVKNTLKKQCTIIYPEPDFSEFCEK